MSGELSPTQIKRTGWVNRSGLLRISPLWWFCCWRQPRISI